MDSLVVHMFGGKTTAEAMYPERFLDVDDLVDPHHPDISAVRQEAVKTGDWSVFMPLYLALLDKAVASLDEEDRSKIILLHSWEAGSHLGVVLGAVVVDEPEFERRLKFPRYSASQNAIAVPNEETQAQARRNRASVAASAEEHSLRVFRSIDEFVAYYDSLSLSDEGKSHEWPAADDAATGSQTATPAVVARADEQASGETWEAPTAPAPGSGPAAKPNTPATPLPRVELFTTKGAIGRIIGRPTARDVVAMAQLELGLCALRVQGSTVLFMIGTTHGAVEAAWGRIAPLVDISLDQARTQAQLMSRVLTLGESFVQAMSDVASREATESEKGEDDD